MEEYTVDVDKINGFWCMQHHAVCAAVATVWGVDRHANLSKMWNEITLELREDGSWRRKRAWPLVNFKPNEHYGRI